MICLFEWLIFYAADFTDNMLNENSKYGLLIITQV